MGHGVSGFRGIFGLAWSLLFFPLGLGGIMGNDWMTRNGKGKSKALFWCLFGGLSVFHGYGSVEDLEGPFASWIMRPVGTLLQGTGLLRVEGDFFLHAYGIDETEDWNRRGELLLRSMITSLSSYCPLLLPVYK